jgi:hypothetical protein
MSKLSFIKGIMSKLSKLSFLKNIDRNTILIGIAVVAIIVTGVLIVANSNHAFTFPTIFGVSNQKLGELAVNYINDNKLSQTPASLVSVSEVSGLVKAKIKIGTSEFDSYITKDGKLLFPQAFEMSLKETDQNTNTNSNSNQNAASVAKTDSPMLEAYVVARCPYGIQMQRAMADAVKNMPSLAQYIKVRYLGSVSGNTITAMHGEAEAKENLRQICIREEQPAKYWAYVDCQMKAAGTETSCEQSTGVDSAKLSACTSDPKKGVAYAKEDFDLSAKYKAGGSPTLILNGATISESNYGGRSSDGVKSMACAGFNSEPSFCSTKLNTTAAAASFSLTYSSSTGANNSNAGCQ